MTSLTCSFEERVQPPRREDRYAKRGVVGSAVRTRPRQRRQRGIIISLHAQPRRSRRRHRRERRIERGASVRASLPSSGPSRLSLSSPFLSLLLRRRARSTYLCNETIPHFCSPPRSSSSMRWQRRCCQVMHAATREKKKRRSSGPAGEHHGMSSESFYLLRGGRGRGFRGRRGINSRGSIVRRAAGQARHAES